MGSEMLHFDQVKQSDLKTMHEFVAFLSFHLQESYTYENTFRLI